MVLRSDTRDGRQNGQRKPVEGDERGKSDHARREEERSCEERGRAIMRGDIEERGRNDRDMTGRGEERGQRGENGGETEEPLRN